MDDDDTCLELFLETAVEELGLAESSYCGVTELCNIER